MQPYFLPYLGYFQLINAVDKFVLYDNIKYTKKGWINRNQMLQNGKSKLFSLPLEKASDFLNVSERKLSINFDRKKLMRQIHGVYSKSPHYTHVIHIFEDIINYKNENLFDYIHYSLTILCDYLEIDTPFVISSTIDADTSLKKQDKVLDICQVMEADSYINPIGGIELYDKKFFEKFGISLNFIRMNDISYEQFGNEFVPSLSILDVCMFNSSKEIKNLLSEYKII